jgi:hypothetical protein
LVSVPVEKDDDIQELQRAAKGAGRDCGVPVRIEVHIVHMGLTASRYVDGLLLARLAIAAIRLEAIENGRG